MQVHAGTDVAGEPEVAPSPSNVALLRAAQVVLEVRLGAAEMSLRELLDLKVGSVVRLDTSLDGPVELVLGEKGLATGAVVADQACYAVKITSTR